MTRVVSLLPSATEVVCALGLRGDLVGRSEECDFPESVRTLPVVMRARTSDFDRPSAAIDERVREALAAGESLYELDLPLLRSLEPDVVLTQDLCRVCSVTDDEVRDACFRAGVHPTLVSLTPTRLDGVWASIEEIGRALRAADRARQLAASLARRASGRTAAEEFDATVVVLEWLDPPIVAGLWTPEMVALAGGRAWGAEAGAPGRRCSWPEVEAADPDLVVLSPCSFHPPRTRQEVSTPSIAGGLARLAPRLGTWIADEAYFSRPGPRLADGVELLRALLGGGGEASRFAGERYETPTLRTAP